MALQTWKVALFGFWKNVKKNVCSNYGPNVTLHLCSTSTLNITYLQ